MKAMPLITVIISAYNAAKYIQRCLESVARQTIDSSLYTVKIYDDGSQDKTCDIATQFSKKHKNMRVVRSEENVGLGFMRNRGIRETCTPFLTFLDADDTLPFDTLESFLSVATDTEIVYGDIVRCAESGKITGISHRKIYRHNMSQAMLQWRTPLSACGVLYNRNFIVQNDIFFSEKTFFEDIIFSLKASITARSVAFVDRVCYNHFITPNSITNFIDKKKIHDAINIAVIVHNFLSSSGKFQDHNTLFSDFLSGFIRWLINILKNESNNTTKKIDYLFLCISKSPLMYKANRTLKPTENRIENLRSQFNLMARKSIVFVADADYHIRNYVPIIRQLDKLGMQSVIIDRSGILKRPCTLKEMQYYKDVNIFTATSSDLRHYIAPTALAYIFSTEGTHGYTRDTINNLRLLKIPVISFYEGIHDDCNIHARKGALLPYRLSDHLFLPGEYYSSIYSQIPNTVAGLPSIRSLYAEPVFFPDTPTVLINCNFSYGILQESRINFLSSAISGCKQSGVNYAISQHPADDSDLSEFPLCKCNVYDGIRRASIVISRFSTCILEALALGKPVIYHNPHGERFPTFQSETYGAFWVTKDSSELENAITKILCDINSGVDFRARADIFLHRMTNHLSANNPEDIVASKISQIAKSMYANLEERVFCLSESTTLFPEHNENINQSANSYMKTIQMRAEELKGKKVLFWGCGEIYHAQKYLFSECMPVCILIDTEVPHVKTIDGLEVKHAKDFFPCQTNLPIIAFAQDATKIYHAILKYCNYCPDIIFCSFIY